MKSLSDYDLKIGGRVRQAMSDEQKKKADKTAGEVILNTETTVYAFMPQMSYVPKEMVARDATFWGPKTEEASARRPARKRPAKADSGTANPQ